MKFMSFNINGLRAHIYQLEAIIKTHYPDIISLQETKVHDDMFPLEAINQYGYHAFYHGQKSHYGVALLTKKEPISVRYGLPGDHKDAQRRIIMADLLTNKGVVTIINGYFPQGNNRKDPIKFPAKTHFYQSFQTYLERQVPVDTLMLVMGDMNISHSDFDVGIGEKAKKRWLRIGKCSFLPEEREWMSRLLSWGLVDTYRRTNPTRNDEFSWFDYRSKGFEKNHGLRIDLILVTPRLAIYCTDSGIDRKIRNMERPSDHAPVWAEFALYG